jgi:outer membrane protein OmpA-like peptidoglycan-associated protein/tetratricopeptide (TPR) repeat protein
MKKIIISKFIVAVSFFVLSCTNGIYRRGVISYNNMEYNKAIVRFEKYLQKKVEPIDSKIKLADSYRMINDFENAEKWFSKIVDLPESEDINMFHYGRILMSLGKYEQAKNWFEKYLKKAPDDFVAEMLLASCQSVDEFKKDTTLFSVKEADIPEVATAFAQIPYGRGIIFTADKVTFKNNKTSNWTGRSYLDLYFTQKDERGKWISPALLKGNINGQFHEGPACFNKNGNIVYFTRSNYWRKKRLAKNDKNENNLKLFRAELINDEWKKIEELPFNSDDYSCGHPTLSADEKTLFFISDMPGGIGGTDIYKSEWKDSVWTKPENLGNIINTSGNEMFPYMHSDGTFYFSSTAHINMGGLDVFMSSYDGHKWLQAENLNYPLNTSKDDFAFVLNEDNKTGFVSSNRYEHDKIFEITKNDPSFILSGYVWHKGRRNDVIDSAIIEIKNLTTNFVSNVLTDKQGFYTYRFSPKSAYLIKAWKPMHFSTTDPKQFDMTGKKYSESFTANFEMDEIIIEKPIVLDNIYYDLDKWFIRPDAAKELDKLVTVMNENPTLKIELSSHTDSRAGDQYNLVLSDKRAKAAVAYLVSKGVDAKRMTWKGYGESKLVNHCKNNVSCSEEEHQKNRRTEFKAVKEIKSIVKNK